jgi:hypothetical protein
MACLEQALVSPTAKAASGRQCASSMARAKLRRRKSRSRRRGGAANAERDLPEDEYGAELTFAVGLHAAPGSGWTSVEIAADELRFPDDEPLDLSTEI